MQCLPLEICDTTETMNTEAKERERSSKEGGREGRERERGREGVERGVERERESEREKGRERGEGYREKGKKFSIYRGHNKSFLTTTGSLMALELIDVVIIVYQTLLSSLKK